ncbi:hypothetical protein [Rubinisphaera margarita]|uniref:hypothetical protein n=1 Tax=Rubinisphaera margarita TaxID=2909586 RepID=UPI001EE9A58A|nr:hypothetical protein [Rubinisphaera margarita]MCG6156906.1 hypothetical protein [Rubinisphaera margarita]
MIQLLKRLFSRRKSTGGMNAMPYAKAVDVAAQDDNLKIVFLNPLLMLLAGAEKQKGSPLTKREVFAVRDSANCLVMPAEKARAFGAALGMFNDLHQINPRRCWTEWQQLRDQVQLE